MEIIKDHDYKVPECKTSECKNKVSSLQKHFQVLRMLAKNEIEQWIEVKNIVFWEEVMKDPLSEGNSS